MAEQRFQHMAPNAKLFQFATQTSVEGVELSGGDH